MQSDPAFIGYQHNSIYRRPSIRPRYSFESDDTSEQRYADKVWRLPNPFWQYCMANSLAPWMLCPPYLLYEQLLRHSAILRAFSADPLTISPELRDKSQYVKTKTSAVFRCWYKSERLPQAFPYQRLENESTIRVLYVLPGGPEEPLVCSLLHHDRRNCPPYSAVSYAWSHSTEHTTVSCNNRTLRLPMTIKQLITRIRSPTEKIALWIDTVCIDQSKENEEKNVQVPQMGLIYATAEKVISWVGEEDYGTPFVDRLFQTAHSHLFGDSETPPADMPGSLDVTWQQLGNFLRRPWFRRAWVLQEVCLAQQCELRCGSLVWNWETLYAILSFLKRTDKIDAGMLPRLQPGILQFYGSYPRASTSVDVPLCSLLPSARGTQATDPKDKVYAILPMAQDSLGIEVDYDCPVEKVYTDAAARFIRQEGPSILCIAGEAAWNNVRKIPSWVPDWSSNDRPETFIRGSLPSTTTTHWQPKLGFTGTGKGLKIQAVVFETIRTCGVPWHGYVYRPTEGWEASRFACFRLESWQFSLRPWDRNKPAYRDTAESFQSAFAHTIIAGSRVEGLDGPQFGEFYDEYRVWLRDMCRLGSMAFHSEDANDRQIHQSFHSLVMRMCYKRTFFLTKGGYMGLGPFFTLPFDKVVAIPGVESPLIMRRTMSGKYKVVGACYVHGLGIEELMKKELQEITIL